MEEQCDKCKHWVNIDIILKKPESATSTYEEHWVAQSEHWNCECGVCFRFPPKIFVSKADECVRYSNPVLPFDFFCGEFQEKIDIPEIYSHPISELILSARIQNCLASHEPEIKTIGDLVQMTTRGLLLIEHFGGTSLREVKRKLAYKNLFLKDAKNYGKV